MVIVFRPAPRTTSVSLNAPDVAAAATRIPRSPIGGGVRFRSSRTAPNRRAVDPPEITLRRTPEIGDLRAPRSYASSHNVSPSIIVEEHMIEGETVFDEA
jgi:hypothetical protein